MPIYRFKIDCKPTAGSPRAADIESAIAYVWVASESIIEAEVKARSHLLDYAWIPSSVLDALEPTPEQIVQWGKPSAALHRKALRQGVASLFHANSKVNSEQDNDQFEIRSMGDPLKPTDREQ